MDPPAAGRADRLPQLPNLIYEVFGPCFGVGLVYFLAAVGGVEVPESGFNTGHHTVTFRAAPQLERPDPFPPARRWDLQIAAPRPHGGPGGRLGKVYQLEGIGFLGANGIGAADIFVIAAGAGYSHPRALANRQTSATMTIRAMPSMGRKMYLPDSAAWAARVSVCTDGGPF